MEASCRLGHLPHSTWRSLSMAGVIGSLVRGLRGRWVRLRPLTTYSNWGMFPMCGSPNPSAIWQCRTAAR